MIDSDDIFRLPADLPVPRNDGACDHLIGSDIPSLHLPSTHGGEISLRELNASWVVVYCYPLAASPGRRLPKDWNKIPGARGCTPQGCAFRDLHADFASRGAVVFGLSTQAPEQQREFASRLQLPFALLCDSDLVFARALQLPTFTVESQTLIHRLTIVASRGIIRKVFYPVFPPSENPQEVLGWIDEQTR